MALGEGSGDRLAHIEKIIRLQTDLLEAHETAIKDLRGEARAIEAALARVIRVLARHRDPEIKAVISAVEDAARMARQMNARTSTIALFQRLLKLLA
jgi:hypothetical protein